MTEYADLAHDTAVTRDATIPGRYRATLPPSWSFLHPSGGVLMTVALRAATDAIGDPTCRLVSATTTFCSALEAGALTIDVAILRRGRSATQVRATMRAAEASDPRAAGLEVDATFARRREGLPELAPSEPPDVPRLDTLPDVDLAAMGGWVPPIYRNFQIRRAIGDVWQKPRWEAAEPATARYFSYGAPQTLPDGHLDPLALPPLADTMASAFHQGVGAVSPRIVAPSLDLSVHFLAPTRSEWVLVASRCRFAGGGIASGDAALWDADGRLLAVAFQTMFLRRLGR